MFFEGVRFRDGHLQATPVHEAEAQQREEEAGKHSRAVAEKKAKGEAKQKAAAEKDRLKALKKQQALQLRLSKMSEAELEKYNAKQTATEQREEDHWLKEKAKGDAFYAKMQAELTK